LTDYGETATGFRRKTFPEIQSSIKARLRGRIDARLALDDLDWVGNAVDVFSDELDLAWQALEVARNGFDPANAEGALMVALAALTGTRRNAPTFGLCPCTLGLLAGKTFAPGDLVAHVEGDPTNRWYNRDEVTSVLTGSYPGNVFICETAGARPALSGLLTVIAGTKSGWQSITNPSDATAGQDLESIDDLRVRREEDLETQASGSAGGIESDVLGVAGVVSAKVLINDTEAPVGGMPPHSIRVIVWDGISLGANNVEVAQAILESKGAATTTVGASYAEATDANGNPVLVYFDRATQVPLYVVGELEVVVGADPAAVTAAAKVAIVAGGPSGVGERAVFERIKSQAFTVGGVTDVLGFALGTAPAPSGTVNVEAAIDQILILDTGNITLTITETLP
jgi:uncharacterized phage protein gp47/JayE